MSSKGLKMKKMARLYLHASMSGYTCMQAYPGGNTKRDKWVYLNSANPRVLSCLKYQSFYNDFTLFRLWSVYNKIRKMWIKDF